MRAVELRLLSTDPDRSEDFELRIESQRGDIWTIDTSLGLTSGTPDAERRILLADNERITIVPRGSVEIVFDRAQNAAMTRAAAETQPTDAEKAEIEARRQKEIREGAKFSAKAEILGNQAAEEARTQAIADAQQKQAERLQALREEDAKKAQQKLEQSDAKRAEADTKLDENPTKGDNAPNQPTAPANAAPKASVPPRPATATTTATPSTPAKPGMTAPAPSTGGQSSKDVKKNG